MLHLVWHTTTLRIHPRDMLVLADAIATTVPRETLHLPRGLTVQPAPDGSTHEGLIHIWIGDAGIALTTDDWLVLRALLLGAAARLRECCAADHAPAPAAHPIRQTVPYQVRPPSAYN